MRRSGPASADTGMARGLGERMLEAFCRLERVSPDAESDGVGGVLAGGAFTRIPGGEFRGKIFASSSGSGGFGSGGTEKHGLLTPEPGGRLRLALERSAGEKLTRRDLILRERDGAVFRLTGECSFAPASGRAFGIGPSDLAAADVEPVILPDGSDLSDGPEQAEEENG